MKRKRIVTALLSVSMLLGLLAGCGGKAEAPSIPQTESEKEEVQSQAPVEESAADVEEEASETEAASSAEPETVHYSLPLVDAPTTFTVYTTAAPGFMSPYLGPDGSYNSAESTRNFAQLTGVTLQYIEIDMMSFSQNFNLMIASGDYPDLISGVDGYAGGYTKAMDDGVIIDLTDYVENAIPAYRQRLDEADAWKDVMNDEGQMLAIYSLNTESIVDRGPVVRKDWMEALNLEEPTDYEGWTEMGKALMNGYNLPYAFYFSNVINPSITLSAGFDLPELDMTTSGTHFYQKDGQVESALVSDNFKDFLSLLHEWYAEGLISRDFFTQQSMDVKEELAEKLGVPAENLAETVRIYNESCKNGFDIDCFKEPEYLIPMTGPYYGFMTALNTDGAFGGVQVNENIQAKAKDGGLVEGLWVPGDFSSSRFINDDGLKRQIINDLAWAFSSGFIAGEQAAAYLRESRCG